MSEEDEDILLKSVSDSGVKIPAGVSSVKHLTPPTFFSICSQSLRIITQQLQNPNPSNTNNQPPWEPPFVDDIDYYTSSSMPDRLKICSDLASTVNALGGFFPNITFHNFLYPSEEDLYKLIRFFVKKLSELPEQVNKVPADRTVISDFGDTSSNYQANESANDGTDLKAVEGFKTTSIDPNVNSDIPETSNSRIRDTSNEEVLPSAGPDVFQKLKEVEQEIEDVFSETKKRTEELSKLSADIENQPKTATSRRSYIQRITEITKNSRKQDADIERILKDTRELQEERNYIQERLCRTYAVVDETVFREGKKDLVGRQAYKLLISIHERFEQISDKILSTDRIRRETVEYEAKVSALSRRSFNVKKLQADLDAIRRENELLERHGSNDGDSGILRS